MRSHHTYTILELAEIHNQMGTLALPPHMLGQSIQVWFCCVFLYSHAYSFLFAVMNRPIHAIPAHIIAYGTRLSLSAPHIPTNTRETDIAVIVFRILFFMASLFQNRLNIVVQITVIDLFVGFNLYDDFIFNFTGGFAVHFDSHDKRFFFITFGFYHKII